MFLWCLRDEWRQGQTAILTQLLLTVAGCVIFKKPLSASSASWLGLLNRGSLRVTGRSQSASWFWQWPSCHQLTQLPPTRASLIDGSVKSQYITVRQQTGEIKYKHREKLWLVVLLFQDNLPVQTTQFTISEAANCGFSFAWPPFWKQRCGHTCCGDVFEDQTVIGLQCMSMVGPSAR